ncbi:MAG TPA: histidine kinase [Thermomicrobiales bacterium]|jgi:PAS domain S-box-containing protein
MRDHNASTTTAPTDDAAAHWREHARHAALRAEVSLALAEPGTPRATLQRCAEALVAHLDAAFARIWTVADDGATLELQASAGRYTHLDGPHGRIAIGHLKIGLIAQERRPYLTNAVIGDPRVHEQGWARREGMVAFAGYPLIVEARLVGVMALFAQRPLTATTLDALASVAAAIGQGIERQRAEAALREREAAYRGVFEATSDGLLIGDFAGQILAANPAAGAIFGHDAAAWPALTLADLLAPDEGVALGRHLAAVAAGEQFRAQLAGRRRDGRAVPLEIHGSTLSYGGQARLLCAVRDITERVEAERLRDRRVHEERQRLARELHDSVTQSLYGITLYSTAATRQLAAGDLATARDSLAEIGATAQEALAELRLLIFELRPPILAEAGLIAALQARLDAVEGRIGTLKTRLDAPATLELPPAIEESLYRIAQEALNNTLKHAHARQVTVALQQDATTTRLRIGDDGVGFDPHADAGHGGLGLRGIAERAALLGARLDVTSAPDRGTAITVEVPR